MVMESQRFFYLLIESVLEIVFILFNLYSKSPFFPGNVNLALEEIPHITIQ